MDDVLHLHYFGVSMSKLTAVDAWKLINSLIHKKTLKRQIHGFRIEYSHGLTEEQLASEFKIAPEKRENSRYRTSDDAQYTYRFQTRSEGLVLNVELEKSSYGARRGNLKGYISKEKAQSFVSNIF